MKGKRIKGYKKEFNIYQTALNFKSPYKLIVEPTFIEQIINNNINLKDRLEEVIGSNFKLISPGCVSNELKKLKLYNRFNEIYKDVKLFNRKCNHSKLNSKDCILKQIEHNNPMKYIVASSNVELNNEIQSNCFAAPYFSTFKGIVIMSSINQLTKDKLQEKEKKKNSVLNGELKFMEKKFELQVDQSQMDFQSKKKKPKAPNPLSIKKKTKQPQADLDQNQNPSNNDKEPEKEQSGKVENSDQQSTNAKKRKRKHKKSKPDSKEE